MRIYELRTYLALPGRLPALLTHFEHHTIGIWKRLGIRPQGFWAPITWPVGNELIYFPIWDLLAQRESRWASFLQDSEWHEVCDRSET